MTKRLLLHTAVFQHSIFRTVWHSPTLMTYGSFFASALSFLIVLPILLTRLTTEEIYLWYLFSAITSFQSLVDLGMSATFARIIAYVIGGVDISSLENPRGSAKGTPNWRLLERVYYTMRYVYNRLGILWFVLLLGLGSLAIIKPITVMDDNNTAWIAWFVVLTSSIFSFIGITYASYLQGINHIAVFRRWEIITTIGSTITSVLVLVLYESFLFLIIVQQSWLVLKVVRNRWLARKALNGRMKEFLQKPIKDRDVLNVVWKGAWRTGVGAFMGYGIIQASGIIYAQFASPSAVASYFLALRLIQVVSQFSQAPFYSKLPMMSIIYSEGKVPYLIQVVKRSMILAYITFIIGFITLGFLGTSILDYIGSNADFPDAQLWSLVGIAYFFERYGAMHINLYSITNNIINHIANSGAGLIYLSVSLIGFPFIGIYATPAALIIGNVCFYSWYAASHSYKAFDLNFFSFENTTMLPFLGILIACITIGLLL